MNEVVSQALGGVGKVLENFVLQSGECLLEVSFSKVPWRIRPSVRPAFVHAPLHCYMRLVAFVGPLSGVYLIKPGAEEMGKYAEKLFHGRLPASLLFNTPRITFLVAHRCGCLLLKVNNK